MIDKKHIKMIITTNRPYNPNFSEGQVSSTKEKSKHLRKNKIKKEKKTFSTQTFQIKSQDEKYLSLKVKNKSCQLLLSDILISYRLNHSPRALTTDGFGF